MKNLITLISGMLLSTSLYAAQECQTDIPRTAPNTRFAVSSNGTVEDLQTGLVWMRCPLGMTWDSNNGVCSGAATLHTWQSALTQVQSIDAAENNHALHQFAGIANWRLPNIKELMSLTEAACHSPAMNGRAFNSAFAQAELGDLSTYLWSNTSAGDGTNVWTYSIFNAETYAYTPSQEFGVLLVADKN
ncbi:DUF1566 domain-containing protein [Shewanella sp. A3A]|nr:DUF1566 domain-containing protein [Shewanella ferrihydritica]